MILTLIKEKTSNYSNQCLTKISYFILRFIFISPMELLRD